MPSPEASESRSSARTLFFVTAAGLIYGSLYPFHFTAVPSAFLVWAAPAGLSAARDAILNIVIYLPFGFLLASSLPGSREWKIAIATAGSFLFSGLMEIAQAFDQGRFSSLIDLLLNTLGGLAGALCAAAIGWRAQPLARFYRYPGLSVLVLFALASHLYPFFPIIHRDQLLEKWSGLTQPFPVVDVFIAAAEWLALRALLDRICGRSAMRLLAFAMLTVPAGLVIVGQPVSGASILGALFALLIGRFWQPSPRHLAPWLVLVLVARELAPFHFSSPPQRLQWVPFSGFLESLPGSVQILFSKLFFYGAAVWAWDTESRWPAAAIAALVMGLEWLQRWIPGRTPEVTDSLLVLLVSGISYCLSRQPDSQPA